MGWQTVSHRQLVLQPETCWCYGVAASGIARGHSCQRTQQHSRITEGSSMSSSVSVPAARKSFSTIMVSLHSEIAALKALSTCLKHNRWRSESLTKKRRKPTLLYYMRSKRKKIGPVQKTNPRQVSSGCILAVSTISHDGGVEWAGAEILWFFILKLWMCICLNTSERRSTWSQTAEFPIFCSRTGQISASWYMANWTYITVSRPWDRIPTLLFYWHIDKGAALSSYYNMPDLRDSCYHSDIFL